MQPIHARSVPATAIFTLAEIKAATEAFDRGDANACDALDAILVAVEAYRVALHTNREAA
jgi:hypothetical protein